MTIVTRPARTAHSQHTAQQTALHNFTQQLYPTMWNYATLILFTRQTLHDQLHWLDVPDRVLAVTVHECLNGRAQPYLSWSTASRSPVLTCAGICVPPTVTYLPYRVSRSTLTAVGRSQLLARWPGTHFRILSAIQRAAQTVLCIYLKRTCSRVTSASSALGVLNDYALYKSTH